ncbi:transposase [Streptomyces sp. NPDC058746]|uniref:transposase n=1 Tax=Streptomyces sp. NPDC058746 TaxID=3346622 RepID=UPI0036774683
MRSLFEVLAGPIALPTTPGTRFGAYRTVSFDGCSSLRVPGSPRNRAWLGRTTHHGYPTLELMTLVETGTRSLIGAVFGTTDEGETAYARRLLHLLRPGMLVLWDKGFDANAFLAEAAATGAKVLGRLRSNRRTPVLARLGDGSYLSLIGTVNVRIIDAEITVTCADGTLFTGLYRLVTTLTDARRHPAAALVDLYHERWEHESAYYALRHTILAGRNLRSNDPAGLEQEVWALLALYQALRAVMVEAAESVPGTDPDRCCFTVALQTARDQVVQALGVVPDQPGPIGLIGRRVLARLLAPRRQRTSTRKVKSPISRYSGRRDDGHPDRSRTITALTVSVREPGPGMPPLPTASRDDRHTVPASADGTAFLPCCKKTRPGCGEGLPAQHLPALCLHWPLLGRVLDDAAGARAPSPASSTAVDHGLFMASTAQSRDLLAGSLRMSGRRMRRLRRASLGSRTCCADHSPGLPRTGSG